jgi:tetratricopeptide (TPR) repeat protein
MLLTQCCLRRLGVTRLHIRSTTCISLQRGRGFSNRPQPPPVRYEPDPDASPENVQNEFIGHTLFAFRNLGRIVAFVGYGALLVGLVTATAYEGGHLWIEGQMRIPADEDAKQWGWEPEGWTGGENGGTSSSLGFVGRHAVRAAWFSLHNTLPFGGTTTISQADGGRGLGSLNVTGSDLESARMYLEKAIACVHDQDGRVRMDRVGSELLERHAAVLERIGTRVALSRAREEYLQILVDGREARRLSQARLAVKIGDISERLGNNEAALTWWNRGIDLTSDDVSSNPSVTPHVRPPSPTLTHGNITSTFWKWTQKTPSEDTSSSPCIEMKPSELTLPIRPPSSPEAQRTLVAAILSISAHYSKTNQLKEAKGIQEYAISLIDGMVPMPETSSSALSVELQSPGQILHQMYLLQRKSILALHHAEVTYSILSSSSRRKAVPTRPLTDLVTAASLSEIVAQVLTDTSLLPDMSPSASSKSVSGSGTNVPHPVASHALLAMTYRQSPWLHTQAQSVLRDARRTAVEAWDLCGVLYGEVKNGQKKALECYERALGWAEAEEGLPRMTSVDAWQSLWDRYTDARRRVLGD